VLVYKTIRVLPNFINNKNIRMMKRNILYKLLGLALLVVGVISCDTASQDVEPVVSPDGYPVATFVNSTGTTVTEGDTIIYDISIDKTIDRAITFSFNQTGGTCNSDDYYVVPAVISPYYKSAQLLIVFNKDYDYTASETLIGTIGAFSIADRYLLNLSTVNPTLNATVNNYVSDIVDVVLEWSQEVTVQDIVEVELTAEEYGNEYTYTITDTVDIVVDVADEVDWDIFVIDGDGNLVDMAATGNNPEELELNLPDGEYLIVTDLWTNGLYTSYYSIVDTELTMPITATFTRQGTELIDFSIVQDPSQVPTVDTPGYDDTEPPVGFGGIVCGITVAGGKYTIVEYDGNEIGPYKGSSFHKPVQNR
jgi:hypothetical protein